jgi:hypothetical protein
MSAPFTTAPMANTDRTVEAPTNPAVWIPASEHPEIWAALAAVGNSPGVIDHTTPGTPMPARTEGDLQ